MAQLDVVQLVVRRLQCRPASGWHYSFLEMIIKYFLVILCLPPIQEGQLSVSGGRICKILVNA